MSIDSRLRQGLERSASGGTPDLVDNLPDALIRGRRRKRVTVVARVTALAAGLAIVALGGSRLTGSFQTDQPAATPSPSISASDFSVIAGTYTVELTNTDATVDANHMAGTWTITLSPDGAMRLSIPAGFTREGPAPAGNAFTLATNQFRTNLFYSDFCHSIGVYGWQLRGARLTFTPLSEDCAVRQAIFSSQPWVARG
jgi:hypothetical protein